MEIENIHIQCLPERTVSVYAGDRAHMILEESLIEQGIDLTDSLESITNFDRVVMQFTENQYLIGEPRCLFFNREYAEIKTLLEINESFPEIGVKIQEYVDSLTNYINNDN